jgi:hypothetical protein
MRKFIRSRRPVNADVLDLQTKKEETKNKQTKTKKQTNKQKNAIYSSLD